MAGRARGALLAGAVSGALAAALSAALPAALGVALPAALAVSAGLAGAAAQTQSQAAFRILNEERLLRESRYGQAVLEEIRQAELELEAENERITGELGAEERALTEARAELTPEEFRARADAFDRRVEAIRAERNELSMELARRSDAAAGRFFDEVLPIILQMMTEEGLVAVLRPDALILGADWLDMTDLVIERLDATLGDQPPPPEPPPPEAPPPEAPQVPPETPPAAPPTPETTPQPPPAEPPPPAD